jgi:hypothetical protein
VLKRRIGRLTTADLAVSKAVSRPCDIDGRLLNRLDALAFSKAQLFEAVELSPVTPLGTVSVLTGLDQANVLSTIRALECVADPTLGLALECARRRKNVADRATSVRLCTTQRVLRFPAPEKDGYTAHFKLFSLVTAGRDAGNRSFEITNLQEHIGVYLSLLFALREKGYVIDAIEVEISDMDVVGHLCSAAGVSQEEIRAKVRARDSESADRVLAKHPIRWPKTVVNPHDELNGFDLPKHLLVHMVILEERVCAPLRAAHSGIGVKFNLHRLTGLGYYKGTCFHIKVTNETGEQFVIADGGLVNWTQLLLGDKKERLMTSAIGSELLYRKFAPERATRL